MKTNISSVIAIIAGLAASASSLQAADPAVIDAIKKNGGLVLPYPGKGEQWDVEFHLRGRELTDAGLAHVADLEGVVSLNLRDTKITSAGLAHLKGLTGLRRLHLRQFVERERVNCHPGQRHMGVVRGVEGAAEHAGAAASRGSGTQTHARGTRKCEVSRASGESGGSCRS